MGQHQNAETRNQRLAENRSQILGTFFINAVRRTQTRPATQLLTFHLSPTSCTRTFPLCGPTLSPSPHRGAHPHADVDAYLEKMQEVIAQRPALSAQDEVPPSPGKGPTRILCAVGVF